MQARTTQPPDPSIISSLTTLETHRYRDALFYVLAQSRLLGESCKETKLAAPSTSPDHETLQPPTATNEGSVVPNTHFFALRALPCPRSLPCLLYKLLHTVAPVDVRSCFDPNVPNREPNPRARARAEKLSAAMAGGEQQRWLGDVALAAARGEGEGGAGAAAGARGSVLSAGSVRWELHLAARIKEESEKTM